MEIKVYDTTLRDGTQMEGVSLTVLDKLAITEQLDWLGVHYIEGGFPVSNPKDEEFFRRVQELKLANARLAAFGMTRRAKNSAAEDATLKALVASGAPVAVVGKSWDFHVTDVLRVTLDENLRMIADSVRFLKEAGREVIFDAEHFFDGYTRQPRVRPEGARCGRRGRRRLPRAVRHQRRLPAGVHRRGHGRGRQAHRRCRRHPLPQRLRPGRGQHPRRRPRRRDACAGHDQRLRRALRQRRPLAIIPNLSSRWATTRSATSSLQKLTEVCASSTRRPTCHAEQPALRRAPAPSRTRAACTSTPCARQHAAYEHIDPELVGNERRFLISELSGALQRRRQSCRTTASAATATPCSKIARASRSWRTRATSSRPPRPPSSCWSAKRRRRLYSPFFDAQRLPRHGHEQPRRRPPVTEATVKLTVGEQVCTPPARATAR